MKILVKLNSEQNAAYYGVTIGSAVSIPFEEYLCGVVAAELGGSNFEALKAQAVASRTFAYPYVVSGKAITDSSSSHQAFNALRLNDFSYQLAYAAVDDTEGEVLYYGGKIVDTCVFSSCNHGRTTSAKSRWGSDRPYLIEQADSWDAAAIYSKKRGHGVGMSQIGAIYASKQGISYKDILSFYYPGTTIVKEGSPVSQVKSSDLIALFNQMADEKWKYVAGAHKQGEVDCSGAFYYAYKKLGSYMYHGSNTMWRKYTKQKGKIGEVNLMPGMAVFKRRDWSSAHASNGWYNTDPGDVYHVGMYVGDGWVVEAQGKKTGVVKTKLSTWHLAAQLVDTLYDVDEAVESTEPFASFMGVVKINSGWLNLRSGPDSSSSREAKAYNDDTLNVVGEKDDWYIVDHSGKRLYASKKYIVKPDQTPPEYIFTIKVSKWGKDNLREHLSGAGYVFDVQESWDAA